jgi:hypothetical protein
MLLKYTQNPYTKIHSVVCTKNPSVIGRGETERKAYLDLLSNINTSIQELQGLYSVVFLMNTGVKDESN